MKNAISIIFLMLSLGLYSQNRSCYSFTGVTYNQQYPNGSYIKNLYIPNIETGVEYRINQNHVFGIMPDAGLSTHNFGLTRYSDNYSKIYLRVAPFAGLNILADFDKNNENKLLKSIWFGPRLAFFNRFCPNAFFNAGVNFHLCNHNFYIKWSTPLFYCFPDQNLWAKPVDMDDNYYPLGNERWSITAGVQFGLGKKKKNGE